MIVETIALFWVICCVVIWFIHRKKKKVTAGKLKKRMICVSIIVFAGYFMSNLVKCTISFASLEKAVSFYGNTKPQGQPLIGTETALVPQLNDGLELSIYHKKQNKWKLPCWLLNEDSIHNDIDENTNKYMVSVIWDGNTDSCYIFLWDSTENGWKKRNVKDSENSNFIYFESKLGKGLNVSIYYSYLKEVPSDYKLYIDDYEIEVDWRELLENR